MWLPRFARSTRFIPGLATAIAILLAVGTIAITAHYTNTREPGSQDPAALQEDGQEVQWAPPTMSQQASLDPCQEQYGLQAAPFYTQKGLRCLDYAELGGLDLMRYCQTKYGPSATSFAAGISDAADNWRCDKGGKLGQVVPVDYTEACRLQYQDPQLQAAAMTPGGNSTWTCIRLTLHGGVKPDAVRQSTSPPAG